MIIGSKTIYGAMKNMKTVSFKRSLLRAFIVTSVLPIVALGVYSFFAITQTLHKNTENLMKSNMAQTDTNLQISLDAYEDVAYQIYTDDNMVLWVRKLDAGEDVPATVNQMRRFMNGLLNTKDYIKAITIITEGGNIVTYDEMSGVTTQRSWIDNFSKTTEEIYDKVAADYKMHLFSTEYGTTFANEDFYLFHIAHRIVDYRKLDDRIGIVILTLDEHLLSDIYSGDEDGEQRHTFILDGNNMVISNETNKEMIGTVLKTADKTEFKNFLEKNDGEGKWTEFYSYYDEDLEWTIVTAINDVNLRDARYRQMYLAIIIAVIILVVAFLISIRITNRLNTSINKVASGMKRTQEGDLSTYIEMDNDMPLEVGTMALAYNGMIDELKLADEKEKEANRKQQEAQIAALEAQINPHFLYNTLDTINWMAIEREDYEISNAINALATTLRYAISKSNATVTVRDEMEWLKKYIFLQQFRLKDKFECKLNISPKLMDAPIHKLLMQPFIENAIIHGFDDETENATLWISMTESSDNGSKSDNALDSGSKSDNASDSGSETDEKNCGENRKNYIRIEIRDNGKGIDRETIDQINNGSIEAKDRQHIGMENVITRMRMYYGEASFVKAESVLGEGTVITLLIPYEGEKA